MSLSSGHQHQELKVRVCETVAQLGQERYGSALVALVLTGSLARDEATFLPNHQGWALAGDAEFLAIFGGNAPIPDRTEAKRFGRLASSLLHEHGLSGELSLAPVRPDFLRRLTPHIFAYELRECGQVVWGDAGILSLIPPFSVSDIPLEDGWRMLCNRLVEQLDVVEELVEGRTSLSQRAWYRTTKLFLDMATSLSLFAGLYSTTYQARAAVLEDAARDGRAAAWPFDPHGFVSDVMTCTEWKLAGQVPAEAMSAEFMHRAIGRARQLWKWELATLTGLDLSEPEQRLLTAWMARQPLADRLRGWLSVARSQAGAGNWQDWLRWTRQMWRSSPRYLLYAVATTLLFSLAGGTNPRELRFVREVDWSALRRALPVSRRESPGTSDPAWSLLARDIMWNYDRFLTGTRS